MKPTLFKCEKVDDVIKLTSRRDKLGNIYYFVEFDGDRYSRFKHMSSAIDFIESNF